MLIVHGVVRPCSLGLVLVATTPRGVCAVTFGDDADALWAALRRRFPRALVRQGARDAGLKRLADRVLDLTDADGGLADIPLDLMGTAFQRRVWRALRDVPPGQTATYAEIACRIGAPRAVRAVGTACGANPVAVAVPCHRVVRGDGTLGGYRWGLERKKALLARERVKSTRFARR